MYDVVILGGGSAGYSCALRSAQLGLKVCLIEGNKVGGTCLHKGCIPTKALLHCAEIVDNINESEKYGIFSSIENIDMKKVSEYKNSVIEKLYKGLQGLIKARNVTYIEGFGKLHSKNSVIVNGEIIEGKNIVIATGSTTRTLPTLPIDGRIITSDEALQLEFIPKSAIILGGGVIGVEFASVWNSLGSEVTIIEGLNHLAPNEDESISKSLEKAYKKRNINFKLGTRFAKATQTTDSVIVETENGDKFEAEVLLVAIGRRPVTENIGLEENGITIDRGFVQTNARLHTGIGNIYACGDIVFGLQLAHRGFAHGIFIAEEIAGLSPELISDSNIPKVTYCNPEIASVGLTQKQAEEKLGKDNVEIVEYNLAGNGKSQILNTTGFIKLVREKNGPICGFHAIGERMGELVNEGELIVNWQAYPEDVANLIHAHPTQNEAIGEAAMALAGKPLHAHN
ncbi:dihydrolipoyl dehydrogenase [Actinomyces sp. zg-332]|uniref:dihydrolipoyl dehydrogenase n=1 Tax=Actinomyces sp. zg-332 TaxID=2708340 RepID=UPI00141F28F8|nr:dihydrolipoyl dehydrogenase [Actinomyces sp. zg-332]QPK93779.1 dihydrolipoyl dehydrogenase [Actinomyces sp. zg-332]